MPGAHGRGARCGDLLVDLADLLVQFAGVEAFTSEGVPVGLGLGPVGDRGPLVFGGRVGVDDGFVVEVPAFAALRGPQDPGPLGTGWADRGQGVPARDQHLLDVAGVDVGPAQLDRAQAGAVLGRQVLDHGAGQRQRHPLGPRSPPRGHQAPSQSVPSLSNGPA